MTNGYGWKEHVHVLHINFSTLHWVSWLLVNSLDISHSKKSHVSRLCRLVFSPKGLEFICENLPMYCLKMDLLKWTLTANCFSHDIYLLNYEISGLPVFFLFTHKKWDCLSVWNIILSMAQAQQISKSITLHWWPQFQLALRTQIIPVFIPILYGGFFKWGSSSHHVFFKLSHGHPWL